MIIEITADGNGAWNLTAKTTKDAWPPMYMAYGRSPWAIRALVLGILSEHTGQIDEVAPSAIAVTPQDAETGSGVGRGTPGTPEPAKTIPGGSA